MSQQIEIEFKNLLTKEEYEMLLTHFQIHQDQIHAQENHYFDTPDFHVKKAQSGLRIRILPHEIECTLKERNNDNNHLETTDYISADSAAQMIRGMTFEAPSVTKRLTALNIPIDQLQLYGSLTTRRVEIDYKGGTLVLDHSFYLNRNDYEVEYETNDEDAGAEIFEQILHEYHIPKRDTLKKIARFSQALAEQ